MEGFCHNCVAFKPNEPVTVSIFVKLYVPSIGNSIPTRVALRAVGLLETKHSCNLRGFFSEMNFWRGDIALSICNEQDDHILKKQTQVDVMSYTQTL